MMKERKCVTSQDVRDHNMKIRQFKQRRRAEKEMAEYELNLRNYNEKQL